MSKKEMTKALELANHLREGLESAYGMHYEGEHEVSERADYLLIVARALIARQEPVRAVFSKDENWYFCSGCPEEKLPDYGSNFCPNCGRPLDWRKEK